MGLVLKKISKSSMSFNRGFSLTENNTLVSLSRSLRQASNERKVLEGRKRFVFETPKNKDFQIHPGWSTAWHKQYDSTAIRYPTQLYA